MKHVRPSLSSPGDASDPGQTFRQKNAFFILIHSALSLLILILVLILIMRLATQTCIYNLIVYSLIENAFQLTERRLFAYIRAIQVCTCASRMGWYNGVATTSEAEATVAVSAPKMNEKMMTRQVEAFIFWSKPQD